MLVVAGIAQIEPGRRDVVVAAAIDVVHRTRKLPGCLSFSCASDLEDDHRLHVFLEWQSVEALFEHLTESRVAGVSKTLEALGVREVSIQRFEITAVGPVV